MIRYGRERAGLGYLYNRPKARMGLVGIYMLVDPGLKLIRYHGLRYSSSFNQLQSMLRQLFLSNDLLSFI
jgi:hypothetical protein